MLAVVAVAFQFGTVFIPLEVSADLILDSLLYRFRVRIARQVGVDRQRIPATIVQRFHPLCLSANALHHSHLVDVPDEGRLPVDTLCDTLQGFIRRQMVRALLPTYTGKRIGKHGVPAPDAKLNRILCRVMQSCSPFFRCHRASARTHPNRIPPAGRTHQYPPELHR